MADYKVYRYSGNDGMIEQRAKYLQQVLWMDFFDDSTYPKTLQELDLTGVNLKGITYIPKGDEPYKDYEMHVEYSDHIEIFHPLSVQ